MKIQRSLAMVMFLVFVAPSLAGERDYAVVKTFRVGGEGRWDFVTVDPAAKRLYVPRQSHTQIIERDTGQIVGDIKDTPGVHGVAIVAQVGRGFTSNGQGNSVTVFDLKTLETVGTVRTGNNPDAIIYDPASGMIFAFNGRSHDTTVIDPGAALDAAVKARIELGDKPECAAADGKGRVYVNLEDTGCVAVIDTRAMKVTDKWKIEGGESPSGLALDVQHGRIFVGCANQVMAVMDVQSGKVLATLPIGKGVDGCAFDPETSEAFASCGDGTLSVIKEKSPAEFEVTQKLQTRRGARTMALDTTTHTLYLPTAEFEEAPASATSRPAPKPNTFMVLVIARP